MICQNETTNLHLTNKENETMNVPNDFTNDTKTELEKKNLPTTTKRNVSGIYKIVNKTNGKYYVGSANSIQRRWREHKNCLIENKHYNDYLQRAWNKYGKDNFEFLIVEITEPNKRILVEQKYLDIARNEQDKCYNLKFESTEQFFSDYAREKMSIAKIGKKYSDEVKLKMSNSSPHRKLTENEKEHLRNVNTGPNSPHWGKKRSAETRLKMSLAHKKKKNQTQSLSSGLVTI